MTDQFLPPVPPQLQTDPVAIGYFTQLNTIIEQLALHANVGGHVRRLATVTATTYTVADGVDFVLVDDDTAGGAVTITLPPVDRLEGRHVTVKKLGSTGNVTIDGDGSETVDESTTYVISTQYESITVVSDATEWWIY